MPNEIQAMQAANAERDREEAEQEIRNATHALKVAYRKYGRAHEADPQPVDLNSKDMIRDALKRLGEDNPDLG